MFLDNTVHWSTSGTPIVMSFYRSKWMATVHINCLLSVLCRWVCSFNYIQLTFYNLNNMFVYYLYHLNNQCVFWPDLLTVSGKNRTDGEIIAADGEPLPVWTAQLVNMCDKRKRTAFLGASASCVSPAQGTRIRRNKGYRQEIVLWCEENQVSCWVTS